MKIRIGSLEIEQNEKGFWVVPGVAETFEFLSLATLAALKLEAPHVAIGDVTRRDISEVIGRLLEVILQNEMELRLKLDSVRVSSLYGPPEVQSQYWHAGAEVLEHHFGIQFEHLPVWGKEVRSIWMGE